MLNRAWYRLAGWTGLCALVFSFVGCSNSQNPQAAGGKKGAGGRGGMNMSIPVAVAKAETRDLPVYLSGLGSVDAFNTVVEQYENNNTATARTRKRFSRAKSTSLRII